MKEGIRYLLERAPLEEELNPDENFLEAFTKWSKFKSAVEALSSQRGIEQEEFIAEDYFYREAVQLLEQTDNEEEAQGGILV